LEQTNTPATSKWSLAAKDGFILAAVSVVIVTLTLLTESTFLGILLWALKLGGSIWLLNVIMKRYGLAHPEEPSTFSYGLIVCLCSSIICAVWTFVLYQYLFPDTAAQAIEQTYETFNQMGAALPDGVEDMLLKMEDNYAQINCITTFFWCLLLGLVFSAILSRSGARKSVFTDDEMKQNRDEDEFNF